MPLFPVTPSTVGDLARRVIAGDLTAAVGLLDVLGDAGREADRVRLRELLGAFAVDGYGRVERAAGLVVDERAAAAAPEPAWEAFARDVAALFWLDLYTLDSTVGALADAVQRRAA